MILLLLVRQACCTCYGLLRFKIWNSCCSCFPSSFLCLFSI